MFGKNTESVKDKCDGERKGGRRTRITGIVEEEWRQETVRGKEGALLSTHPSLHAGHLLNTRNRTTVVVHLTHPTLVQIQGSPPQTFPSSTQARLPLSPSHKMGRRWQQREEGRPVPAVASCPVSSPFTNGCSTVGSARLSARGVSALLTSGGKQENSPVLQSAIPKEKARENRNAKTDSFQRFSASAKPQASTTLVTLFWS